MEAGEPQKGYPWHESPRAHSPWNQQTGSRGRRRVALFTGTDLFRTTASKPDPGSPSVNAPVQPGHSSKAALQVFTYKCHCWP